MKLENLTQYLDGTKVPDFDDLLERLMIKNFNATDELLKFDSIKAMFGEHKLSQHHIIQIICSPTAMESVNVLVDRMVEPEKKKKVKNSLLLSVLPYLATSALKCDSDGKNRKDGKKEYYLGEISIDYNGLFHRSDEVSPYSQEEMTNLYQMFSEAYGRIEQTSSEVFNLLNSVISVISIRKNKIRTHDHTWSSHYSVGKIYGANVEKLDIEGIIDFLVHEMIHNLIHMVEIFDRKLVTDQFLNSNLAREKSIESPWSGDFVDLWSYTHAIFVWYGLYNFWNTYNRNNLFVSDESVEREKRALVGFVRGNHLPIVEFKRYTSLDHLHIQYLGVNFGS